MKDVKLYGVISALFISMTANVLAIAFVFVDRSDFWLLMGLIVLLGCIAIFILGVVFKYFLYGREHVLDQLRDDVRRVRMGEVGHRTNIGGSVALIKLGRELNHMFALFVKLMEKKENHEKKYTQALSEKSDRMACRDDAPFGALESVEREKERSEELVKELEKFKLAVENASDHIVITDTAGNIIYANKAVEDITGFSREEVLGQKAGSKENWGGQMSKAFYETMWRTLKEKKQVFSGEIHNRKKSGKSYTALGSISPVLDKNGSVAFFVGIERDISKEKAVDKAKTEFVSLASHQLRTPLTAIKWYAEMLLDGDGGEINEKQREMLGEIHRGNERMVELVGALLKTSRLELGTFSIDPKPTNLSELTTRVIKDMEPRAKKRGVRIETAIEEGIDNINVDPKLTDMMFENLLSNAVKYSSSDSEAVGVVLERKKKEDVIGETQLTCDGIHYEVRDNGMGIPQEQQDEIFSKMFRADNVRLSDMEGTGLGLYLVKSIIDHAGGHVWFESEEGKGSTFHIILPVTGMKKKEGEKKLS